MNFAKWLLLGFLLLLIIIGAIPQYLHQNWSLSPKFPVPYLKELQRLDQHKITFPNWTTQKHQIVNLGGKKWSMTNLTNNTTDVIILLLPQRSHKDQPQVEWMDVHSIQRWKTDQDQILNFTVTTANITANIMASFYRAWTDSHTYAILQWYSWPTGGKPTPSQWFFQDQLTQLKGKRLPWVAVSLIISMTPLGDLELIKPLAIALGSQTQQELMKFLLTSQP